MPDTIPSEPSKDFDPDAILADALRDDGLEDDPHIHDIGADNA